MAEAKVLYWHGIPTQVRAEDQQGRVGIKLPDRFQMAIDEAAMAANLIGEDDYVNGFYWGEAEERPGSAQQVAEEVAAELAAAHPSVAWEDVARKIKASRRAK